MGELVPRKDMVKQVMMGIGGIGGGIAIFLLGGLHWIPGLIIGGIITKGQDNIQWVYDVRKGLSIAKQAKKPAMIDFTAEWCVACKELEKYTFPDPKVQKELERFICIKAVFAKNTPAVKALAREHSIRGLPTVDFHSSDGKKLMEKRILGFVNAKEFLRHIETVR